MARDWIYEQRVAAALADNEAQRSAFEAQLQSMRTEAAAATANAAMMRVFRRMDNARTAAAWRSWVGALGLLAERARVQRTIQRTVRRLELAGVSAAWRTWQAAVDVHREHVRCAKIVTRTLHRIESSKYLAAWQQWRAVARDWAYEQRVQAALADTAKAREAFEAQLESMRAAQSMVTQQSANAAMLRVFRRMDCASTAAAWRTWISALGILAERARVQRTVQRTVRRMESARIAAAWRTWAVAVDAHRETLRCGRIVTRVDCPEGVCVADIASG